MVEKVEFEVKEYKKRGIKAKTQREYNKKYYRKVTKPENMRRKKK